MQATIRATIIHTADLTDYIATQLLQAIDTCCSVALHFVAKHL
jgi:hypothetical protein